MIFPPIAVLGYFEVPFESGSNLPFDGRMSLRFGRFVPKTVTKSGFSKFGNPNSTDSTGSNFKISHQPSKLHQPYRSRMKLDQLNMAMVTFAAEPCQEDLRNLLKEAVGWSSLMGSGAYCRANYDRCGNIWFLHGTSLIQQPFGVDGFLIF